VLDLSGTTGTGAAGIVSVEPLRGLTKLLRLYLGGAARIISLDPLKGLRNLRELDLSGAWGIDRSLEPLEGLTNLQIRLPNGTLACSGVSVLGQEDTTAVKSIGRRDCGSHCDGYTDPWGPRDLAGCAGRPGSLRERSCRFRNSGLTSRAGKALVQSPS
jgi:hypothetical protein